MGRCYMWLIVLVAHYVGVARRYEFYECYECYECYGAMLGERGAPLRANSSVQCRPAERTLVAHYESRPTWSDQG